ncbi:MBL fold metallo-hydrolase [Curtobacterium sp. MCLR17_045]|uniref:MBL fold metallo-hydrolase n=1 Tax=Curtobacterium sp. MCLR17_045 TaxID=2175629 RepID=UPI000DA8A4E5|nr:MBL fold metallo-hydrolase [Curtobacterium sp. MCLR17_045]PZF26870.1 MBL fold metallo-hydrolase [Curtobacterium sp. MCLR17_045]
MATNDGMRIIKYEHATVRIEQGGYVVVIDPGIATRAASVERATAILITHAHDDHWSLDLLRATDAPIYTIAEVAAQWAHDGDLTSRTTVVHPGERFEVGLAVTAVGERHATIHPSWPTGDNTGYLVEGERRLFHPGDALTLPGAPIDVLCLPISGPWSSLGEVIDYAQRVDASVNLAVHEMLSSAPGLSATDYGIRRALGAHRYARLDDATELRMPRAVR